tara:strand:- start:2400 stop:4385 length:1986 start_codon:yes stop_codon:yes gene_type:complete
MITFTNWVNREFEKPILYYINLSDKEHQISSKNKTIKVESIHTKSNKNSKNVFLNWMTKICSNITNYIWIYWGTKPFNLIEQCNQIPFPINTDKHIYPLYYKNELKSLMMSFNLFYNYKIWFESKYISILSSFKKFILHFNDYVSQPINLTHNFNTYKPPPQTLLSSNSYQPLSDNKKESKNIIPHIIHFINYNTNKEVYTKSWKIHNKNYQLKFYSEYVNRFKILYEHGGIMLDQTKFGCQVPLELMINQLLDKNKNISIIFMNNLNPHFCISTPKNPIILWILNNLEKLNFNLYKYDLYNSSVFVNKWKVIVDNMKITFSFLNSIHILDKEIKTNISDNELWKSNQFKTPTLYTHKPLRMFYDLSLFENIKTNENYIDVYMIIQNRNDYIEEYFQFIIKDVENSYQKSQFRYFILENDSDDNTLQSLKMLQKNHNVTVFSYSFPELMKIRRPLRLGILRNYLQYKIKSLYLQKKIPFAKQTIVIDSDIVFSVKTLIQLIEMKKIRNDYVMLGINCQNINVPFDSYYDSLALNYASEYTKKSFKYTKLLLTSKKYPIVDVRTCFGGIVIIDSNYFYNCNWGYRNSEVFSLYCKNLTCEHYQFCNFLLNWGKIGICTYLHGGWTVNWNNNKQKMFHFCKKNNFLPSNSKLFFEKIELKENN